MHLKKSLEKGTGISNTIVKLITDCSVSHVFYLCKISKSLVFILFRFYISGIRNSTAFSVRFKTANPTMAFKSNAIVKFNKIISNNGNGFSMATGKFTCKIPGLYFFTVTIISETNQQSA